MRVVDGRRLEQIIVDKTIDPQEKFETLWEYYHPRLLLYTRSFKGLSDFEPKDIVADILSGIFKNLHKYNQIYSLSTWVYNIARNYLIDLYRKNKRNAAAISIHEINWQDIIDPREHGNIVDKVIERDTVEECRQCIKSLNEKEQRMIFLRYYEGLSSKEIALIEGMSHNAVRKRLMNIRLYIKKLLGEDYEY
jgi:RNA polymerase sigma-70 factor (ECF subfamily)